MNNLVHPEIGQVKKLNTAMLRINTKKESTTLVVEDDWLQIEDFNSKLDQKFIDEWFHPYLKDMYADLKMRSN